MHDRTVTQLLHQLRVGNRDALAELLPLVYAELHDIAERQRRRWTGDETMNTTALVHEAYLRLADQTAPQWLNYPHFLAVAATAMRQILVDYAKRRSAAKRGGRLVAIPLHELEAALSDHGAAEADAEAVIALDGALERLKRHDERQSRIVECRVFGAMSIADTAEALGISPASVKRGWAMAQAWLYRDLASSVGVTS